MSFLGNGPAQLVKRLGAGGGFLLIALAAGAFAAPSASALRWEECTTIAGFLEYSTPECSKSSPGSTWGWEAVGSKRPANLRGPFPIIAGKSSLECEPIASGAVGPEGGGEITKITASCSSSTCESAELHALDLPWTTTLISGKEGPRVKFSNGGSGEPGWKIECDGTIQKCIGATSAAAANEPNGTVALVFDAEAAHQPCGGGEEAIAEGSLVMSLASEVGLREQ